MFTENPYPILEFDDNREAKLDPEDFKDLPFDTDRLVITFFPEVLEKLAAEGDNLVGVIWRPILR